MKLTGNDCPRLQGTAIFAAAALALGMAGIIAAGQYVEHNQTQQAMAQEQVAQVRSKLSRVQEERRDLDAYYEEYQRLVSRGVVGDEKRLDWIEAIDRIREQRSIFSTRYAIAPQKAYLAPAGLAGGINLVSSEMTLQLTLLHEGELLNFFDALRRESNGLFLLQGCRIERIDPTQQLRYAPQLNAECALEWLTLKQPGRR